MIVKTVARSAVRVSAILLASIQYGCSYYGYNTYLTPKGGNAWEASDYQFRFNCSGGTIGVNRHFLVDRDIKVYALAGIPIFPGVSDSFTSDLGSLNISYQSLGEMDTCSIADVSIKSESDTRMTAPISVWQSRTLSGRDGRRFVTCAYQFDAGLKYLDIYSLEFNRKISDCAVPKLSFNYQKRFEFVHVPLQ